MLEMEREFIFRDGKVYTMVEGRVVQAEDEQSFQEPQGGHQIQDPTQMPPPPDDMGMGEGTCQSCQAPLGPDDQFCSQCGQPVDALNGLGDDLSSETVPFTDPHQLHQGQPDPHGSEAIRPQGNVVVTPNGLKGQLLGKVAGLWSDEVTVRLENGRVVRLNVTKDLKVASTPITKVASSVADLREEIEKNVAGDATSLRVRKDRLAQVKTAARNRIGQSDATDIELNEIIVLATHEQAEIVDRLEYLASEEVEAFEAPAPFRMQAVEQESLGRDNGSWLDSTLGEMVAEAEATDYPKLLREGPEVFVAAVDTAVLGDQGAVRQMAARYIRSHTAAASDDVREQYEGAWLERVEACRRAELSNRKETARKEAAEQKDEFNNLPDDVLFFGS
jgi:hypothetical protein